MIKIHSMFSLKSGNNNIEELNKAYLERCTYNTRFLFSRKHFYENTNMMFLRNRSALMVNKIITSLFALIKVCEYPFWQRVLRIRLHHAFASGFQIMIWVEVAFNGKKSLFVELTS